ncbi:MAG: hypothetical protein HYS12_14665 [Planctomycetes bacterium]|nr:hypothetical protein [Planctomycetota bacterium]
MPLHFPYLRRPSRRPVFPLGGALYRFFPIFPVIISTAHGSIVRDALLDTGANDTVCPDILAPLLGLDLTNAPEGEASGAGGSVLPVRYATVRLRITDTKETCEWDALVGFAPLGMSRALLGQTGFLHYFDVYLLNPFREIILTPNSSFGGQHTLH